MSIPKIVVHTDVVVDHLCGNKRPSTLRLVMSKFFCYTTVFQAVELFALARTDEEAAAVEAALATMKVLGLNAKSAPKYGKLVATHRQRDRWNVMIAGLCIESRLPILTDRARDFAGFEKLTVVPVRNVVVDRTAEEIVHAARQHR